VPEDRHRLVSIASLARASGREAARPGSVCRGAETRSRRAVHSRRSATHSSIARFLWCDSPEADIGTDIRREPARRSIPRRLLPWFREVIGVRRTCDGGVPEATEAMGSFVCLVGTGAPCYPATPTDNAIRDQRGWVSIPGRDLLA
jgi:hypothetical protein